MFDLHNPQEKSAAKKSNQLSQHFFIKKSIFPQFSIIYDTSLHNIYSDRPHFPHQSEGKHVSVPVQRR